MTVFWIVATLMTGVALAFVLVPLLRASARPVRSRTEANLEVLRGQRRELDADVAAGTLSPVARDEALAELVARAESDLAEDPRAPTFAPGRPVLAAVVSGLAVPALAFGLYFAIGNPAALDPAAAAPKAEAPPFSDAQIVAMVDNLAAKVRERPDDAQGWSLLARSLNALGRFPEAVAAYEHLARLAPEDVDVLADWADALAMTQGRSLAGKPYALVKQALAKNPKHQKTLALAGTAALNEGDNAGAIRHWETLAAQLPPGSDDARKVATVIGEIRARGGSSMPKAAAATPPSPAAATTAAPATLAPGGGVSGTVAIAPDIAAKVSITDTLFIYARAEGGSRMPLAILRAGAKELPRAFMLDDSMGMAPGVKLSTTPAVRIEARVSKTGNAMPQAGDLVGTSAVVKPGARDVKVVIDKALP